MLITRHKKILNIWRVKQTADKRKESGMWGLNHNTTQSFLQKNVSIMNTTLERNDTTQMFNIFLCLVISIFIN